MSETTLDSEANVDLPKTNRFIIARRVIVFLTALLLFSLIKLPDTKLKGHLNHFIFQTADRMGYLLSATNSDFRFGLGISYSLKDVTLSMKGSPGVLRLDSVQVSPSFLSLLTGKIGGSVEIQKGKGLISGNIGVRGSRLIADLKIDSLNLSDSPLALYLSDFKIQSRIDGKVTLEGPLDNPSAWNGEIQLKLGSIRAPAQTVMSFPIPEIKIDGGTIQLKLDKGVALIETFHLGTLNKTTDDIAAKITGEIVLKPRIEMSTLKLNAHFSFAPEYLDKSELFLIQSFIASAKQPDGSFKYTINGPLYSPSFDPVRQ
jgi:type II secretion system protein N